jgi:hypothetical protein
LADHPTTFLAMTWDTARHIAPGKQCSETGSRRLRSR